MNHHRAHNTLLIFAAATFAVTVALYVYIYGAVNAQTRRVVMAKDIQKVQHIDEEQVAEAKKLFEHSKPAREALKTLFVPVKDVVAFIETLESIGTRTGATVSITSINEVKIENETVIGTLKAHVEAKGSWSSVSKTLIMLETMQKSYSIDSLRLDKEGASNTTGGASSTYSGWTLSLDITAHTLK